MWSAVLMTRGEKKGRGPRGREGNCSYPVLDVSCVSFCAAPFPPGEHARPKGGRKGGRGGGRFLHVMVGEVDMTNVILILLRKFFCIE